MTAFEDYARSVYATLNQAFGLRSPARYMRRDRSVEVWATPNRPQPQDYGDWPVWAAQCREWYLPAEPLRAAGFLPPQLLDVLVAGEERWEVLALTNGGPYWHYPASDRNTIVVLTKLVGG